MVIAEPGSDGYYEELNARQKKTLPYYVGETT